MNLVLLRMFLAILDGHYNEYDAEVEKDTEKLGFFAWIVMILREESEKIYEHLKKVNIMKN